MMHSWGYIQLTVLNGLQFSGFSDFDYEFKELAEWKKITSIAFVFNKTLCRGYMISIAETVDDRRPIRKELQKPDDIDSMHNKWTFPTALLYVLTVLTTCGTIFLKISKLHLFDCINY